MQSGEVLGLMIIVAALLTAPIMWIGMLISCLFGGSECRF